MHKLAAISALALGLSAASTQAMAVNTRNVTGAAIGAGAGAVVAGPPGAVVGGVAGAVIGGPALPTRTYRHCWWKNGVKHCR